MLKTVKNDLPRNVKTVKKRAPENRGRGERLMNIENIISVLSFRRSRFRRLDIDPFRAEVASLFANGMDSFDSCRYLLANILYTNLYNCIR